jgi:hypothetical protein
VHIPLGAIWFDPADISGIITLFMVLYPLHDAMANHAGASAGAEHCGSVVGV